MRTKIGYKVVSVWYGKYYSWTTTPSEHECVKYIIGKTSKPRPRCGPLCVFSSIKKAKGIIDPNMDKYSAILKVRFVPSKEKCAWTPYTSTSKDELNDGTILADSVTPVELIK